MSRGFVTSVVELAALLSGELREPVVLEKMSTANVTQNSHSAQLPSRIILPIAPKPRTTPQSAHSPPSIRWCQIEPVPQWTMLLMISNDQLRNSR